MPPKPKFTREEIVRGALALVSERGVSGLTARELGVHLGSSSRPIFTVFRNMEELLEAVRAAAMERFEQFAQDEFLQMPVFKQVGMKMVLFGTKEPKLYQLLFMQESREDVTFADIYPVLGGMAEVCIDAIMQDYQLDRESAKKLFEHVWIYTYGVGTLCATGVCHFTTEQMGEMLSTAFHAMMLLVQKEEFTEQNKNPAGQ